MKNIFISLWVVFGFEINAQEVRSFPSVNLKSLTGETISTSQISNNGNPILIIVWATWCHHAVDGMNNISDEYLDVWVDQFNLKVVTVSVDDSRNTSKVAPMVNSNGWEFEHYLDPNADFKRAMGVNQPPHLFILNGKKEIVWSFNSFNPGDEEQIESVLKAL